MSRWSAATGGFLTQVILFTGSSTLPLLLLAFEEALGLSSADAGLIISVYGVFYVIGAPVWGAISDRVGLQKALTSSSLIVSMGIFAMGAVNSLMACLAVYALIGFGSVALVVQIPKLLGMWFDSRTKGKASSFITSAGPLCTSILGVIVPILAIAHSWRAPFYVFGSVNLVLSLIIFATTGDGKGNKNLSSSLGSGPKPSGATEAEPQGRVKAKDVLRMRGIWHIATLNILFLMSSLCISTFLVAYLVERGLQTTEAGVGFSVLSAASFAGMYLWGVLSDHMQRKYILVASTFLSVAFTSVFLTFQMNMLSTFLLVGLMGVSTGIAPVFFAVISDYFNFKVVGTATGVIFAMLGVGFILAPLIAGHLAYVTGSFASVFRLSIVLAGASSVLAMLLKRSPKNAKVSSL